VRAWAEGFWCQWLCGTHQTRDDRRDHLLTEICASLDTCVSKAHTHTHTHTLTAWPSAGAAGTGTLAVAPVRPYVDEDGSERAAGPVCAHVMSAAGRARCRCPRWRGSRCACAVAESCSAGESAACLVHDHFRFPPRPAKAACVSDSRRWGGFWEQENLEINHLSQEKPVTRPLRHTKTRNNSQGLESEGAWGEDARVRDHRGGSSRLGLFGGKLCSECRV
jgi:hypothetical protein